MKTLTIKPCYVDALERMAVASSRNPHRIGGAKTPQEILDHILNSLDQAIDRPGSWERGAFESMFGEDLDYAEPSPEYRSLATNH